MNCIRCNDPLTLEMERDTGKCVECQARAAIQECQPLNDRPGRINRILDRFIPTLEAM